MKEISELDKAALKHDFRMLYKDIGRIESFQVLYELLVSANILLDVIQEETKAEIDNQKETSDYNLYDDEDAYNNDAE